MFESGLAYIRCDFHLHTHKDKEFKYSGAENSFIKDYSVLNAHARINSFNKLCEFGFAQRRDGGNQILQCDCHRNTSVFSSIITQEAGQTQEEIKLRTRQDSGESVNRTQRTKGLR